MSVIPIDWTQVSLNGGVDNVCFHMKSGVCCGRRLDWDGHPVIHKPVTYEQFCAKLNIVIPAPSEDKS